jgi:hypothetical protein
VNGENIIMSISENDALWNNISKELAKKYKALISAAIIKYKSETSFGTLAKEISVTCLDFYVCINFDEKFFNWTAFKIKFQEDKRIQGIKSGTSFYLMPSNR